MPPQLLFNLLQIDLSRKLLFDKKDICKVIPQRYEMQQLDGIIWYDKEKAQILGYKDVTDKEFWIRGHIPSRPLMPAVIMIEAGAQLFSFFAKKIYAEQGFVGFGGIESARFRSAVEPGNRLYLLGHIAKFQSRKYTCNLQGVVNDNLVFEATIAGIRMRLT